MTIHIMGKFTAIGMHTAVPDGMIVADTCSHNDTSLEGSDYNLSAFNPTNRRFSARHLNVEAVSTEALWQGLKAIPWRPCPDPETLAGRWGRGKKARPIGHWNGDGEPLLTSPGEARRAIYIPAYRLQVERWLAASATLSDRVARLRRDPRPVFLRDYDTGRGVDRDGPMSHAWVLAMWLNTGEWPERDEAPKQRALFEVAR